MIVPPVTWIVLAALAFVAAAVVVLRKGRRSAPDALKEVQEPERGGEEVDLGTIFRFVVVALLSVVAFAGAVTLAKGLGPGPVGKGAAMIGFAVVALLVWAFAEIVRRGHAGKLLLGLGAVGGVVVVIAALSVRALVPVVTPVVAATPVSANKGAAVVSQTTPDWSAVAVIPDEYLTALNDKSADGEPVAAEDEPDDDRNDDDRNDEERPADERLPAWTATPDGPTTFVVASEPFLSERDARDDAVRRLAGVVLDRHNESTGDALAGLPAEATPGLLWNKLVAKTHVERRETSVGETFVVHALAESDDSDQAWFAGLARAQRKAEGARRGLIAVSAAGGGLLLTLATLYGVLAAGDRPER